MNEAEFEQFMAEAAAATQEKNDLLRLRFGLGDFARWDHDGELDQLTFSNPDDDDILVAQTTDIGSYSLKTNTWLWAWANESLPEASRRKAAALKKLYDETNMRVFFDPHIDCDEYLAWELAAASVQHLGGLGCYRGPAGHLWVFWSIDAIAPQRRERQSDGN